MTARMVRKNGTVIEGVPPFTGWLKLPTFAGALEAALAVTEYPLSYEDILGVSGLAFRVRWYVGENGPTGCPCSPTGESPTVWAAIRKATGWQYQVFMLTGWDNPLMQKVIPKIFTSIDAGRPVLVVDKNLDSAVMYGYTKETFLVQTYYEADVQCTLSELGQTPAVALFLKEHTEPPPFSSVFRDILEDAVMSWHHEKANTFPSVCLRSGKAALEAWISFLTDFEELAAKEEPKTLLGYHIWNYQHLYEARKAAAAFLGKNAGVIPSGKQELVRASSTYQEEAQLLATAFSEDASWQGMSTLRHAYFRGGWRDTSLAAWTSDVRQRMRQLMEQALEIEQSAINLIESACKSP